MKKTYSDDIKTLQDSIKRLQEIKEVLYAVEDVALEVERSVSEIDARIPLRENLSQIKDGAPRRSTPWTCSKKPSDSSTRSWDRPRTN